VIVAGLHGRLGIGSAFAVKGKQAASSSVFKRLVLLQLLIGLFTAALIVLAVPGRGAWGPPVLASSGFPASTPWPASWPAPPS